MERERREPTERLAGNEHRYDLAAAAAGLRAEEQEPRHGHRQITLVHDEGITVILFDFERGGMLPDHAAEGLVMIQVISGSIEVSTADAAHVLGAGSLLVLAAGVRHDLTALEASVMLLTVHLRHA
jgi:quercetin dioxygenase-like cupin family protein